MGECEIMTMRLQLSTWLDAENSAHQTIGFDEQKIVHTVAKLATLQLDEKIREGLIKLGWTPPAA